MVKYDKRDCITEYLRIKRSDGKLMKLLIVKPNDFSSTSPKTGVLWLHGGGYITGYPEMVFMSRAIDLVRECGAVVISPAYRLSIQKPYPAAIKDCYQALLYMKNNAKELGIRSNQIMVGGESAGGGLVAALCMYARDKGTVNIAYQMPLYPMLDCEDTESSKDNHGKVWNTHNNHIAWRIYLRSLRNHKIPKYASPSRCTDYTNLPPAYTYVGDAEPFYCETMTYIENLQQAGIPAKLDIYQGEYHAFDMMNPNSPNAKLAKKRFCEEFMYAREHYFK
jgi:acetyl esterase/lipase